MQTWRVSGGSSSVGGDDFESQSDQNPDVSGRAVLKGLLGSLGAGGGIRGRWEEMWQAAGVLAPQRVGRGRLEQMASVQSLASSDPV